MSYIEINEAKCKSCYLCIDVCPKKLIHKGENTGKTGEVTVEFKDDKNECLGCAMCAMMCHEIAIEKVVKNDR